MNLIMVPQSWQREKVNRLKIKIFLIGHIYEVKIITLRPKHFLVSKKISNIPLLKLSKIDI